MVSRCILAMEVVMVSEKWWMKVLKAVPNFIMWLIDLITSSKKDGK